MAADLDTLVPRDADAVSNTIMNTMKKIEEELEVRVQAMKGDSGIDEIRTLLYKRETDLKSQKYSQWAVNLRNQVGGCSRMMIVLQSTYMHPVSDK